MKKIKNLFRSLLENYGKLGEIIPVKHWNKMV